MNLVAHCLSKKKKLSGLIKLIVIVIAVLSDHRTGIFWGAGKQKWTNLFNEILRATNQEVLPCGDIWRKIQQLCYAFIFAFSTFALG